MDVFTLGQRDHDELFVPSEWKDFRRKWDDAIEALRKQDSADVPSAATKTIGIAVCQQLQ